MLTSPEPAFAASLTLPVQQHRVRLALVAVSGTSGSGFAITSLGDLPYLGDPVLSLDGSATVMRTLSVDTPLARVSSGMLGAFAQVQQAAARSAALPSDFDGISTALTSSVYADVYWSQRLHDGSWAELKICQLQVVGVQFSATSNVATVSFADWTAALDESPMVATYAPVSGTTPLGVSTALYQLISNAFPSSFIGANNSGGGIVSCFMGTDATATKAGLSFTGSRLDAINSLLKPMGMSLINDSNGSFQIVHTTFSASTTVWSTRLAGAAVEEYEGTFNPDSGYNAVSVSWSSADGETFGQVFLVDNDTTSPTYWNGPYGHRIRPDERVDTISNGTDAITYATNLLAQVKGFARTVSMKHRPNPMLQPNDTIEVTYPYGMDPLKTVTESHVIDTIDLPLTSGNASITSRVVYRVVA
jgi:hypothetical protein